MVYALDTNIIILFLRNNPKIVQKYNQTILNGNNIAIPKMVDYEIRRGF